MPAWTTTAIIEYPSLQCLYKSYARVKTPTSTLHRGNVWQVHLDNLKTDKEVCELGTETFTIDHLSDVVYTPSSI